MLGKLKILNRLGVNDFTCLAGIGKDVLLQSEMYQPFRVFIMVIGGYGSIFAYSGYLIMR